MNEFVLSVMKILSQQNRSLAGFECTASGLLSLRSNLVVLPCLRAHEQFRSFLVGNEAAKLWEWIGFSDKIHRDSLTKRRTLQVIFPSSNMRKLGWSASAIANWTRAGQSVPSSLKVKIALLGVFFSVVGCAGPSISRFQITPLALCDRETAVAKWDVQGEPTISFSLEPPPKDESHCAATGRETFTFTLAAEKSGKDAEKQIEVVQVRDGATEPIAFQTSRLEGSEVVASGEKNPSLWTDRVRIASLNACQNRAIQVEHSGKSVFLSADGKPSDALAGTELTGTWELRSPLKPDEQTTPNLRPAQLEILATLRCEEAR